MPFPAWPHAWSLPPYPALLIRSQRSTVGDSSAAPVPLPFSGLFDTSMATRLFYKHLASLESHTCLLAEFAFRQRWHLGVETARFQTRHSPMFHHSRTRPSFDSIYTLQALIQARLMKAQPTSHGNLFTPLAPCSMPTMTSTTPSVSSCCELYCIPESPRPCPLRRLLCRLCTRAKRLNNWFGSPHLVYSAFTNDSQSPRETSTVPLVHGNVPHLGQLSEEKEEMSSFGFHHC
ncbi:hypothetical protein J3F84DRAFT_389053 [Trichoderma pleuroticola]